MRERIVFTFEMSEPRKYYIYVNLGPLHPFGINEDVRNYFGLFVDEEALYVQPVFMPIYLDIYPNHSDLFQINLKDLIDRLHEYYYKRGIDASFHIFGDGVPMYID